MKRPTYLLEQFGLTQKNRIKSPKNSSGPAQTLSPAIGAGAVASKAKKITLKNLNANGVGLNSNVGSTDNMLPQGTTQINFKGHKQTGSLGNNLNLALGGVAGRINPHQLGVS